jgi:hypothetical protein
MLFTPQPASGSMTASKPAKTSDRLDRAKDETIMARGPSQQFDFPSS